MLSLKVVLVVVSPGSNGAMTKTPSRERREDIRRGEEQLAYEGDYPWPADVRTGRRRSQTVQALEVREGPVFGLRGILRWYQIKK